MQLSPQEESLKYYQDSGFYMINLYLRNKMDDEIFILQYAKDKTKLIEIKQHIKNIDELFVEKSSNNLKVFRGVYDNKIIYTGKQSSFYSTSLDINIAKKFAGKKGIIYEFRIDDGIPYIERNMWNNFETEILLPRNLIYTLVSSKTIEQNLYCIMNVSID
jgi:hypothetical protein